MVSSITKGELIKKQKILRLCKWNKYFCNETDVVSNYTLHNLQRYIKTSLSVCLISLVLSSLSISNVKQKAFTTAYV